MSKKIIKMFLTKTHAHFLRAKGILKLENRFFETDISESTEID